MENFISYIAKVNLIINEYNKYKIYFGYIRDNIFHISYLFLLLISGNLY